MNQSPKGIMYNENLSFCSCQQMQMCQQRWFKTVWCLCWQQRGRSLWTHHNPSELLCFENRLHMSVILHMYYVSLTCKTISLTFVTLLYFWSLMPSTFFSPLIFLLLCPEVWSYEAPEDKQDVFATRACPAFLTFTNAAYLTGATVELPCHCKPQQVPNKQELQW